MMKQIIGLMALVVSVAASAQVSNHATGEVGISREVLGSGTPGAGGWERATPVLENDIFHAPQYMPQYPTAGVIYPRVVEVPCKQSGEVLKCEGYHWLPKYGRGEYLFFTPKIAPEVASPQVVVVPGPRVLVEVPVKRKKE